MCTCVCTCVFVLLENRGGHLPATQTRSEERKSKIVSMATVDRVIKREDERE